jgi:6-phosphogluconolactonase (cycloisomerase 2 family)
MLVTVLTIGAPALRPATVAAADPHHPVGFVYVNLNTPTPQNTVAAFARAADGTLTPLAGSPFAVGGQGLAAGLGSQGAVQLSEDGRFLFAVDAGSNQISVLRVQSDGSLLPVPGSPFSSNGAQPVSLAVEDHTVFVANTGTAATQPGDCNISTGGGSNYTGFQLDGRGQLTPLANATYCVPPGSGLGDVLLSPNGRHLLGARVNPSLIDSFDVDEAGELTVSPGSPFAAQAAGPFGSSFRPTNPAQVFVSNAHAGPNAGSVSAYTVARNATLTPVAGSPFPDQQTAPCWLAISADGRYLFAVNTASQTISSYAIAADGTLTLLGAAQSHVAGTITDVALTHSGRLLYVLQGGATAVTGFSVQEGTLTELAGAPFALPATALHPSGIAVE